jgi:hypothetical protein
MWCPVVRRPVLPSRTKMKSVSSRLNRAHVKKTNTIMVNEEKKIETVIAPTHDSSVKSEN